MTTILVAALTVLCLACIFAACMLAVSHLAQRDHARLVASIKKGDEVLLSSGLYARILRVDESSLTVEIAPEIQVKVLRENVAGKWDRQ